MNGKLASENFEAVLRTAQPRLFVRVQEQNHGTFGLEHFISEADVGWDELISEGYEPTNSPLGGPVYWRVVTRAGQRLYLSTFLISAEHVVKAWGEEGLAFCDRNTGMTVARIETLLPRRGSTGPVPRGAL